MQWEHTEDTSVDGSALKNVTRWTYSFCLHVNSEPTAWFPFTYNEITAIHYLTVKGIVHFINVHGNDLLEKVFC